jgi:hypothetical protein
MKLSSLENASLLYDFLLTFYFSGMHVIPALLVFLFIQSLAVGLLPFVNIYGPLFSVETQLTQNRSKW